MVLMLSDATDSLIFPEEVCLFYSSDLLWRVHDARLSVPEGLLKHMPGACLLPAGPTPLSSPSPARHEKPLGSTLGRHDFNNEKKHMDHDQLIRARVTNYLILLSKVCHHIVIIWSPCSKRNRGMPQCWNGLSLSLNLLQCASRHPSPVLLFRFV